MTHRPLVSSRSHPRLCALCTSPIIGTPRRAPFGRNDALVDICRDCDSEHPRSGRYGFGSNAAPGNAVAGPRGKKGRAQ